MKASIFALVVVSVVLASAEPQFYYPGYGLPWQQLLRTSQQQDLQQEFAEGRLFFGTQTVTLGTTTVTTTATSTTTCTTSTAALSACSPSGRRRRSVAARGLYFEEEEESVFLPSVSKVERSVEVAPEQAKQGPVSYIPFIIQPGFEYLANNRDARFLVAFTSATKTVTTTTTTISQLIAICSSTTSFQLCGSNGK